MPRGARIKSESGIYHVMIRGINKQDIFEDDEDRVRFLGTLEHYKNECGFNLYAYCLMGNHIHLLIKENDVEIGIIMKRIGTSFVFWYNWKYKRFGHLFQDRYKSEAVEDDSYFLTVIRYIHQNPLKAGINDNIADYRWSSYSDYFWNKGITDTDFALQIFDDKNESKAAALFEEFNAVVNDDICLEYEEKYRIDDDEAREIIKRVSRIMNINEIQSLGYERRNEIIKELKEKEGLSIRQICRLTGISFNIVRA